MPLIHEFEGKDGTFEPRPVQDPAGNWEIGWGHKLPGPIHPVLDSVDRADDLAKLDLFSAAASVCVVLGDATVQGLTEGQYAALTCFTFNEGVTRFRTSTMAHMIMNGSLVSAGAQLSRWVYASIDGVETILPGLVRRRAAEKALWDS